MKTHRYIFAFLLFLNVTLLCSAQEKGFLTTYSEPDHSWFVTDAIETSNGNFMVSAYDYWGPSSFLLKLSSQGEILVKRNVIAEDSTIYAYRFLQIPEDNGDEYMVLCPCHPADSGSAALVLLRVDEDLNIVSRRTIPCSFFDEGNRFFDAEFLLSGTSVYAALTLRSGDMPNCIFLTRFVFDGNLLNCQRLERDSLADVCNLFHDENDRIGLFGSFGPSHMGFLAIDDSLQSIGRDSIFQWTAPEGNNGESCHYFIHDMISSQAVMLPNGSHIVSARLSESLLHPNGYPYQNDRSVIMAKYEDDFHQPEDMLIIEHMNDSLEYPAFFRSMDFRETSEAKCKIYQCTILNEHPEIGMLQPYPTGIVVTKTDQDLNVEWKKRFLRDGNYQAMVINATSDGGCLVAGSLGDFQARRFDVFALKINADGTVGLDEIQEENIAFVYPNPAKGTLKIGGVEAKESHIYNALGQCVMSFLGNEANVQKLAIGAYLLKIADHEGKTQTLRLIVDKTN